MAELDGERVKKLRDLGLVSDDFYNKVAGSQLQTANPDIRVAETAPAVIAADPDMERKRELYNIHAAAGQGPMNSGNPATMGMDIDNQMDSLFDKHGGKPKNFDTAAWQKAEEGLDREKASKATSTLKSIADIEAQNEVRVRAGLDPLPVPNAPAAAPAGSSVSQSGVVPASYEGILQPRQGQPQQGQGLGAGGPGLLDSGLNKQRQGILGEAEAAAKQGIRDTNYLAGQQLALEEHKNKLVDFQVQKEKLTNQFVDDQKKFDQQIAAASPKNWWAEQGTGVRIGAAIAMGLGAYSSAINGGPNQAMQIIDSAIKNDMQRQQMKWEQLRDKRKDAQNMYGIQLARVGDSEHALTAMYAAGLEKVKLQLQESAATAKTDQAKSAAQRMIGEVEAKQGAMYLELGVKMAEKQQAAQKDQRQMYVPHFQQFAASQKGAETINELAAATNSATDGIKQLLTLSQKGGKSLSPSTRAEAETTGKMVEAALRVPILGPGTVNDKERELMSRIVANPTEIFSMDTTNRVRLQTLLKRLDANLHAQGKAYGLQPVAQTVKTFGTPRE